MALPAELQFRSSNFSQFADITFIAPYICTYLKQKTFTWKAAYSYMQEKNIPVFKLTLSCKVVVVFVT